MMSAVEELERLDVAKFDEAAFVEFLENNGGASGWGEGGRWELIEGLPIDMPPATIAHGIIAQNFERLLLGALISRELNLDVQREAGVRHPTDEFFRPVADLIVYDAAERQGRNKDLFFQTCQLVAEVLSPRTRHHDLLFKRRRYLELPTCKHVILIEQDEMRLRHWARSADWAETVHADPDDPIELPEFGFSCRLKDLYARTDLV
ncbi:hypothetical protein FP2506_14804 [Fulvimarina pelagi HTCC2506]|uniref:Putative restriction endonuclease domain-containing protein n=1 Tax=Fulvimarina pelagi HTCC2506 TaxID=314231 RepID=Q0G3W9_9HYPH|nr:Uma2 family endonuclease [Fulvimarina pelagi]EAU41712.1 hypothetical protein FP2506_14804 [Fulvimarina pelagi HTCC2506]